MTGAAKVKLSGDVSVALWHKSTVDSGGAQASLRAHYLKFRKDFT